MKQNKGEINMSDKLFRILADNGTNTKLCYKKVSEYIESKINEVKETKEPVKKTVRKKTVKK